MLSIYIPINFTCRVKLSFDFNISINLLSFWVLLSTYTQTIMRRVGRRAAASSFDFIMSF